MVQERCKKGTYNKGSRKVRERYKKGTKKVQVRYKKGTYIWQVTMDSTNLPVIMQ